MTIARTRTSPLNNNPASDGRNGNITSPSKDQLQKGKQTDKQTKKVSLCSPVPFELVVCQIKHIEIVCRMPRWSNPTLHRHCTTHHWTKLDGTKSKLKDTKFLIPGKQPWCPQQQQNVQPLEMEDLQLDVTCRHVEFNLTNIPLRVHMNLALRQTNLALWVHSTCLTNLPLRVHSACVINIPLRVHSACVTNIPLSVTSPFGLPNKWRPAK